MLSTSAPLSVEAPHLGMCPAGGAAVLQAPATAAALPPCKANAAPTGGSPSKQLQRQQSRGPRKAGSPTGAHRAQQPGQARASVQPVPGHPQQQPQLPPRAPAQLRQGQTEVQQGMLLNSSRGGIRLCLPPSPRRPRGPTPSSRPAPPQARPRRQWMAGRRRAPVAQRTSRRSTGAARGGVAADPDAPADLCERRAVHWVVNTCAI